MTWPRTAFVTGAGAGLGLALAAALARRGSTVLGLVRQAEAGASLTGATGGRGLPVLGDVTGPSVEAAIAGALTRLGTGLDLLVNNAGTLGVGASLERLDPGEVLRLVDVHCTGALRCTRAALPGLRAAERAVVVNVSSRLGSIARVSSGEFDALGISYAMRISKAALNMATACLARELAPAGIAVHSVHPGRIRTRMASADADLDPDAAAGRLLAWLDALPAGATAGYWDTDGTRLPW